MSIIKDYRSFKTSEYTWNESQEVIEKINSLIADGVCLGNHTGSKQHIRAINRQIADKLDNIICMTEIAGQLMVEDGVLESYDEFLEDMGDKLINLHIKKLSIKCPYCSQNIALQIDADNIIREIDEDRELELYTQKVSSPECFEFKKYYFEITTKSDKFVFVNDLRQFIKTPDHYRDSEINTLGGTLDAVQKYSQDNVVTFFVGNSGVAIYKGENDTYFLTENGYFDEDDDLPIVEEIGYVSCDLWWVMGADQEDIDMTKLAEDEYQQINIIDVVPNSVYVLEYDMTEDALEEDKGKGFKFYKK